MIRLGWRHGMMLIIISVGIILIFRLQGIEGRSKNPVSLLIDAMTHPGADMGLEWPSLLTWRKTHRGVEHVVLGKGQPGGAWQVRLATVTKMHITLIFYFSIRKKMQLFSWQFSSNLFSKIKNSPNSQPFNLTRHGGLAPLVKMVR